MVGGEIYVKKIPSMKITDIADTIAPTSNKVYVGIRPGEKIHEIMCSTDDAPYVFRFKDYYLITPSSQFYRSKKDYKILKAMSYDGRDLTHSKWINQKKFRLGFHYNMPFEHAKNIVYLLSKYSKKESHLPRIVDYPDCRKIHITK